METNGIHLICELSECNPSRLADALFVREACESAANAGNATIVATNWHKFSPQGTSVLLFLAESHLSIHTWPEYGYAAADVYTCGDAASPHLMIKRLIGLLGAKQASVREFLRGRSGLAGYISIEGD